MPTGVYKRKAIIRKGDKYNRLTAIKFIKLSKYYEQYWLFKCDCGNEKVIKVNNVKSGNTKSCGCLKRKQNLLNLGKVKHGMCKTRIYNTWASMKQRCSDKNCKAYKDYGGRGITICSKWLGKNGFQNFYKDMGECSKNKTLDRKNNNGNYCKENCRWATLEEQMNNIRSNRFLTYKNKTQTIAQWARELNVKKATLYTRIARGWSTEKIFSKCI